MVAGRRTGNHRLRVGALLLLVVCLVTAGALQLKQQQAATQYAVPPPVAAASPIVTPRALPSQTPSSTPSATATPSASPSPMVQAIVPTHIFIPATPTSQAVNTVVIGKPTTTCWSPWLKKNVACYGVPTTGEGYDPMGVAAYWSSGPKVGETGPDGLLSVILGHTQIGGYGVFNDIGQMPIGTPVTFTSDAPAASVQLKVLKIVDGIDKTDPTALVKVLQNAPPGAISALTTCSGLVKRLSGYGSSHQYNTVVFLGLASA